MSLLAANINLQKMQSSADEACRLMKVLSNRDRMLLLCQISQGEMCVGELEECLDIHQPTLSQQLTVLRNEELVQTRREGKQIYYSLSNAVALEVMNVLYRNYCRK
jgi:DNA-binding transcriptional ArsR family regulator